MRKGKKMADKWQMEGKTIKGNGERTIRYSCGNMVIESRKVAIPHNGREGSWFYTSYWLILQDGTEKEYHTMKDAKAAGEAALTDAENNKEAYGNKIRCLFIDEHEEDTHERHWR